MPRADNWWAVAAVAVESRLELENRSRALPRAPVGFPVRIIPDADAADEIEPWELCSELALVSPEIRQRARELLPTRYPDVFLDRARARAVLPPGAISGAQGMSLPVAVVGYTLWRLAETARSALLAIAAVVALALFAEVLH